MSATQGKTLDLDRYEGHAPLPWAMVEGPPGAIPDRIVQSSPGWTVYAPREGMEGSQIVACYTGCKSTAQLLTDAPLLLAELRRTRRLLAAGERLAAAAKEADRRPHAFLVAQAAYAEAAKT